MCIVRILKMPLVEFRVIFLFISAYFASADFIEKTAENYGPYILVMEQFYSCRGPKLANLTSYTTHLITEPVYKGSVNLTFLEQARLEDVKMSVYTVKGNQKVLLWNYKVNQPCQHYAMSKVFETYVKAQNCIVKKGTYSCTFNMVEITQSYFGTSFFYGEFIFKATVVSKKGNIICLVFNAIFKKI